MGTSVREATPDGSLATAASAIEGLLFVKKDETEKPTETPPEQTPPAEASEQAPAALPTESESTESTDEEPVQPPAPQKFTVKVDGKDEEVDAEELKKGYLRQRDYTQKTMAAAEERKRIEAEGTKVFGERQQYVQALDQIKALIATEPPNANLPDAEYKAAMTEWTATQAKIKEIDAERTRVAQLQDEEAAKGFARHVEDEQRRLGIELPDYADPEKGPALKKSLSDYAHSIGFTPEELRGVTDHRLVLLLHRSMVADQQAKSQKVTAPKIANKIEKGMATTAPGSKDTAPKKDDLRAQKQRLAQSGKVEDATPIIANILARQG